RAAARQPPAGLCSPTHMPGAWPLRGRAFLLCFILGRALSPAAFQVAQIAAPLGRAKQNPAGHQNTRRGGQHPRSGMAPRRRVFCLLYVDQAAAQTSILIPAQNRYAGSRNLYVGSPALGANCSPRENSPPGVASTKTKPARPAGRGPAGRLPARPAVPAPCFARAWRRLFPAPALPPV
ncbi:unnamed protein product, partial [Amoebophrya sp. A120]